MEQSEVTQSLQILNEKESLLTDLYNQYKNLKIDGVDDREGYKQVDEARKKLKKERTQIEKDAFELREGAVKFQKAVIAREKELISIIQPTEKALAGEVDRIESEKKRI